MKVLDLAAETVKVLAPTSAKFCKQQNKKLGSLTEYKLPKKLGSLLHGRVSESSFLLVSGGEPAFSL